MRAEDDELMSRLAAGDEQALALLLERHWAAVVRYAYGLLGDWDVAEDVGQEAYARLWARRDRLSEGSTPALLYRIVRNASLDVLKSPRHGARVDALDEVAAPEAPDADVEALQLDEAAARAVEALPPRRREVFRLAREWGFSHAEIAEITQLSRRTVANHMSLALSDLRVMLRAFLPSEPDRSEGRSTDTDGVDRTRGRG